MTSSQPLLNRVRASPLYALLSVQLLACLPVLIILQIHPQLGVGSALLVQSSSAAVLSRWVLHQGRWWMPVHLAFLPGVVLLLRLGVNPGWYLLALLLCLLIFGAAWRGHVPLFISSRAALDALDGILPRDAHLHFVDLGCGSGVVLSTVKRLRPGWEVTGVEAAWLPWLWARVRLAMVSSDIRVYRANFWRLPLNRFDVVYAYLSPTPMLALQRKLEQEGGCRWLISYRFVIPGQEPHADVQVADGSHLYRWKLGSTAHGA